MATNKQRDAERQRLQRQLEERRQREASRRRFTLVASIVGTIVVIAAVVVGVLLGTSGSDDKKKDNAAAEPSSRCADVAKQAGAVNFDGVTVNNATTFGKEPKVCSAGTADPSKLEYKDLIVGKGKTPALTSTVSVQYTGQLYKKGTQFDSSWARGGQAASFSLQGVVPGFTQGIGGNASAKIPAMKVGGRRVVILPSALGYGAQGNQSIPPNSSLVFVIDLVGVK